MVHALGHAIGRRALRCDLDPNRLGQHFVGQVLDFPRHGSGEQQRLAVGRQGRDNGPDVPHKSHVEHAVCFIENQELYGVEADIAAAVMVEQAAGRGHDDVDPAAQLDHLRTPVGAAENHGVAQLQEFRVGAQFVTDLDRQFPRRRQDQGAWAAVALTFGQAVQDRQGEGRRLARTGLGDAQHVPAGEQLWDGLGLDRGRGLVVPGLKRAQQRVGEAEIGEGGGGRQCLVGQR